MTVHGAVAVDRARLRLLGTWQLLADGHEVSLGHREQRLISLLGLVDRSARAQVASALWPESTDARALASLRRAVLQCQQRCPGLLVAERLTVALDPSVHVDVDDLRRAAGLTRLPMTDAVAHELLGALRGDELLPGWYDDWVVAERERLEQLRLEALEQVALHGLSYGDLALAEDAAGAASAIDPLRESVREVAIRAHLGRGDVAGAHQEFQRYSEVVHTELGVGPSGRIADLVTSPLDDSHAAAAPVTLPRQRPPLAVPAPAPEPWEEPASDRHDDDDFHDRGHADDLDGDPSDVRHVAAALVGAAGLALIVALAVAVAGPEHPQQATTDPGVGFSVPASPRRDDSGGGSGPQQLVRVRPMAAAAGTAAFAVRASRLPAQVRLVVRGRGGTRVVRLLTVREADGREVVVDGLVAGTYRWSATSASAQEVEGQVSVRTAPDAEVPRDRPSDTATSVPTPTPSSVATSDPVAPTAIPTQTPTQTPTHTPSPSQGPTHTPSPTGTPSDPGTVAPTPVG